MDQNDENSPQMPKPILPNDTPNSGAPANPTFETQTNQTQNPQVPVQNEAIGTEKPQNTNPPHLPDLEEKMTQNTYPKYDKSVLFDTFKGENLKSLFLTESSMRIIGRGIAAMLAMVLFFIVMVLMLGTGNNNTAPINTSDATPTTPIIISPTIPTQSKVETKVGNPDTSNPQSKSPTTTKTSGTPPTATPTLTAGKGPTQKSQYYTISKDYKDITFKVSYEDPNLEVDFIVTDPKKNTYTIGDESKYQGKLVTDWGKNYRLIKLSNMEIEKGEWIVDVFASDNVHLTTSVNGTPK